MVSTSPLSGSGRRAARLRMATDEGNRRATAHEERGTWSRRLSFKGFWAVAQAEQRERAARAPVDGHEGSGRSRDSGTGGRCGCSLRARHLGAKDVVSVSDEVGHDSSGRLDVVHQLGLTRGSAVRGDTAAVELSTTPNDTNGGPARARRSRCFDGEELR